MSRELKCQLNDFFGAPEQGRFATVLRAAQTEERYRALNRSAMSRSELAELKFGMQHWRKCLKPLRSVPAREVPDQIILDIQPQKASPWSWERWSQIPELSEYRFSNLDSSGRPGGLTYRGIRYRAGDLLLVDQNTHYSGIFAGLMDQPNLASHIGIVVILEKAGRYFPAVIESFELGVRAIPLSVFLSADFTSYAEVFRLREAPEDWGADLEKVAIEILSEPHGYDFYAQDKAQDGVRRYLTCTTLISCFFEKTGVKSVSPASRFHSRVQPALQKLGLGVSLILTPTDILQDPRFSCVGVVDHATVALNLARALVAREIRDTLGSGVLDFSALPWSVHFRRWGIGQVQRNTRLGRFLRDRAGFSEGSFPRGPVLLLSIVAIVDVWTIEMMGRCLPYVGRCISWEQVMSFERFSSDLGVQQMLRLASEPYRKYFRPLEFDGGFDVSKSTEVAEFL